MGVLTGSDLLERLEATAGVGVLMNSVGHELCNHLTNMMLATENARHDRSDASFDLLVRQLKQCTALTKAIQGFGSQDFLVGSSLVHLKEVLTAVSGWDGFGREAGVPIGLDMSGDPVVRGNFSQLAVAFVLLLRTLPQGGERALHCELSVEEVLRSRWSDEDQFVPMVQIALRAQGADASAWPPFELSELVEGFYRGTKSAAEMRVMGAWEIVRKVSGRPSSRLSLGVSEGGHPQFLLWLPLATDWSE